MELDNSSFVYVVNEHHILFKIASLSTVLPFSVLENISQIALAYNNTSCLFLG